MRNLLPQKEKHLMNFANSVYAEFRKMKYGIESCRKTGEIWLNELRKDIITYQETSVKDGLCQEEMQNQIWQPLNVWTVENVCPDNCGESNCSCK